MSLLHQDDYDIWYAQMLRDDPALARHIAAARQKYPEWSQWEIIRVATGWLHNERLECGDRRALLADFGRY